MTPFPEKEARRIAKKSDHKWAHHVAILFRGGEIMAIGYNKGVMHAEEMALRKLQMAQGTAHTIRSIRIRRDGKLGASRPCEDCLRQIRTHGIKYVYFSDYDGSEQRMTI
jgi:deoxycytidylate deaminase